MVAAVADGVAAAQRLARGYDPPVSANGYRLLGMLVWRGGRWYLRRRLPARGRVLAYGGAAAGLGALALAVLLRRGSG